MFIETETKDKNAQKRKKVLDDFLLIQYVSREPENGHVWGMGQGMDMGRSTGRGWDRVGLGYEYGRVVKNKGLSRSKTGGEQRDMGIEQLGMKQKNR